MKNFQTTIDSNYYPKTVVDKVAYWLNTDYIVDVQMSDSCYVLSLVAKNDGSIKENIQEYISQLLSDFSLRERISIETQNIRNILYIKAFSNLEDFIEYDA